MKCDYTNYCAVCEQIHEPSVDCQGNPIDWAARKARARAHIKQELKPGHHWSEKRYETN
jgi:hypothetical protein